VIEKFGGLPGVLDADQQQLEQLNGLGVMSASLIRLIKEFYTSYLSETIKERDVLSSPDAVINFSRVKLSGLYNEVFMVVYINVKNEVIDYALLQEGILDNVTAYPRRIIEAALSKHASGIILVHNYPSGNRLSSKEDKPLTKEIADVAFALDLRALDHLIISKQGYFSFMENKMLPLKK